MRSKQEMIDCINHQMTEACKGFIGDPLTPKQMTLIKHKINEILVCFAPHNDVGDYLDIEYVLNNNEIIITPKKNASLWVFELLYKI
jgi:hypothetical protein